MSTEFYIYFRDALSEIHLHNEPLLNRAEATKQQYLSSAPSSYRIQCHKKATNYVFISYPSS